jgi:hypothetical protein
VEWAYCAQTIKLADVFARPEQKLKHSKIPFVLEWSPFHIGRFPKSWVVSIQIRQSKIAQTDVVII